MSAIRTKSLGLRIKASGAPAPEQLTAIREYTLRDFAADELVVREFALCHNGIDRDGEVFDEALLVDFVRTLPGKGVYIRHPTSWNGDSGPAEGRCFAARSERMSFDAARELLREPALQFPPDRAEAVVVYASAYFARTDENAALLTKMDAGIAGDCSIGFCAEARVAIRDSAGRELDASRIIGPGEAHEFSLVWRGAQPGARAVKSAPATATETDMDKNENEIKAVQAENAELKAARASLEAIKAALGGDASLVESPAALASAVAAGKAYRESLLADIVTAERHLGFCGDDEASIKAARDLYAEMPVAKLEAIRKSHDAKLQKGGKVTGSDPNRRTQNDDDAKAFAGTPLGNPIIANTAAA